MILLKNVYDNFCLLLLGLKLWGFPVNPLRAKRVREVANLTDRKNQHTPVYGVKEFGCPSVCLLSVVNFDPNCSAPWAARSLFVCSIYLIYDFLAGNNYPDSHPFAGGMKFATQISPVLNFIIIFWFFYW